MTKGIPNYPPLKWQPTTNQLRCRDLLHSWKPYTATKEKFGFLRTLECERCSAEKVQKLDHKGYIMSTRMVYPDGYLRPSGGRLTKDERAILRVLNIERGNPWR